MCANRPSSDPLGSSDYGRLDRLLFGTLKHDLHSSKSSTRADADEQRFALTGTVSVSRIPEGLFAGPYMLSQAMLTTLPH